LSDEEERRNRRKAAIRSRVEHVFGVIKHIFGWRKVRFKGIAKNFQYAYGVAAAVNIYLHRRTLGKLFGGGTELPLGVS
jgi:IS5 family transposase